MFKEGKSLSGKALHLHLWKAFWPICLTSPLSRLKVIFLIFHTSLPPCSSLHMAVLGNPLKKGSPSAGQTAFSPLGTYPLHFLESVGVALQYDVIFFLRMSYISMLFFIHLTECRWITAGCTSNHENMNMERKKQLLSICSEIVLRYTWLYIEHPYQGTKPPVQHIVYVISEQWPYSYAVRSKFFESDSPISSPSLAWLPWPFSRGVPLSISKLTPYAEDSLCGRETGEREWGKPLRRTFCWRLRLSSTFTIEEYALLCSLEEATGCILMGIPFSGTPLASQMLKQLKYVGAWGIFTLTLLGPHPGRKTNTMGILIISFVSPSGAQETIESSRPSQNVN